MVSGHKRYGEKAFENHGQRITYTREIKLRAIDRVLRQGESYRQVALDLLLTDPKIVHDWVVKYKNEGEESIKDTHSRSHYVTNSQRKIIKTNKRSLITGIRLQRFLCELFISELNKSMAMINVIQKFFEILFAHPPLPSHLHRRNQLLSDHFSYLLPCGF